MCVYKKCGRYFFFCFTVCDFASFVHFVVHLLCLTRYFFPTLVKKKVTELKERIGNENISLPRARAGRSLSSLSSLSSFLLSFFPYFLLSSRTYLCNNDISSNSKLGVCVVREQK